jgi:hypothetical protein
MDGIAEEKNRSKYMIEVDTNFYSSEKQPDERFRGIVSSSTPPLGL